MSRLYKHRQKQNTKQIMLLIGMVFILIGVMFFVGFDSLINSAVLFTNLFKSKTIEEGQIAEESFYGSVSLDTPPIATNSATISISGQVTGFDSVDIYLNNVKAQTAMLDNETVFSEEIGRLISGENTIYVAARTKDGKNSKKTEKYSVFYKRDAPTLEISKPSNGETTRNADIAISGKTDRNTTVHLNNSPIVVDLQGEFETTIRLKEGENILRFRATDVAGNTTETEIRVTFQRDD